MENPSFWVGPFRNNSPELVNLLSQDRVLIHPMVIGELACGTPPDRSNTLTDLGDLRGAQQPTVSEVIAFLNTHKLYGLGCGLVDMTLLASALLSGTALWTLDKPQNPKPGQTRGQNNRPEEKPRGGTL
ncbi:type II toxin-antitoxin system VapC family toxin (plasmid) [Pseudomonas syringae pv. tomato]|uniref:type II toxin-antitoxin system VapC family toxin n=1 Tax=Pseudomonas syringae group genomosp. 3 TaxID=251701 RepID=UPI0035270C74